MEATKRDTPLRSHNHFTSQHYNRNRELLFSVVIAFIIWKSHYLRKRNNEQLALNLLSYILTAFTMALRSSSTKRLVRLLGLGLLISASAVASSNVASGIRPSRQLNQLTEYTNAMADAAAAGDGHPFMQLQSLEGDIMARCLDGSPAAYYFSAGYGDGKTKIIITHQGGGWCESNEKCLERSKTPHGSSKNWSESRKVPKDMFLSRDPEQNPLMHNWNFVYLPYCDGFSFSSKVLDPVSVGDTKLFYRGYYILQAAMNDLKSTFQGATDVVIGGCSAGGLSAFLHCDRWAEVVHDESPNAKVVCAPESGFFVDYPDADANRKTFLDIMAGGVNIHDPELPFNCVANETGDLFPCLFPGTNSKHIETPVFVMQSKYDDWARGPISVAGGDEDTVNKYGDDTVQSMMESVLVKDGNGAFIDSCARHCGGYDVEINAVKKTKAFQLWYEGQVQGDDGLFIQDKPYPCEDCCGLPVPPELPNCEKDMFGHWNLYPSDPSKEGTNWASNWDVERTVESPPLRKDVIQPELGVRQKATVVIEEGIATLTNTGGIFINSTTDTGYQNLEVTVEFKYVQDGDIVSGSGLTIVSPTDYERPGDDICKAQSYVCQIRRADGRVSFQKRLSQRAYTTRSFGSFKPLLGSNLSEDWIVAKFTIHSLEDGSVQLGLFIDMNDGEGLQLAHAMIDEPGQWATIRDVPPECGIDNDSVVYGSGKYVGISNVGSDETKIAFKNIIVRNVLPDMFSLNCGAPTSSPTPLPTLSPSPLPSSESFTTSSASSSVNLSVGPITYVLLAVAGAIFLF